MTDKLSLQVSKISSCVNKTYTSNYASLSFICALREPHGFFAMLSFFMVRAVQSSEVSGLA